MKRPLGTLMLSTTYLRTLENKIRTSIPSRFVLFTPTSGYARAQARV